MEDTQLGPASIPPRAVISAAQEKAKLLKELVTQAPLTVQIGNTQYLKFEAWQTLGRFDRITAAVGWTKPIHNRANDIIGYEARAEVLQDGQFISSAEAQCTVEEANWRSKELWQLRSMAQTRACAKALRNVLSWIVVLAGYSTTPAEEMNHEQAPPKPNWRKFRQNLKDLGVPEDHARVYLNVDSIRVDWLGKMHKTLDDAIDVIKARLAGQASAEEETRDHQEKIPGLP